MKRPLLYIISAVLIILMGVSLSSRPNTQSFNPNEAKATAEYLSSANFKGRLTGTFENQEAASYIKSWFEANGLKPYNGSYYESFDVVYPRKINEAPYLRIVDKNGRLINEYKYGTDFKEDMINFKKNYVKFSSTNSRTVDKNIIQVLEDNSAFVFYLLEGGDLKFRSSFLSDSLLNMCVFLSDGAFKSMSDYIAKGYYVECYIPFEQAKTKVPNVIGVVEGRDREKSPVIISAHFDHLGTDLSGNIYSGALDNASGTAFMMEMVKYIKGMGKPDRDIIFIAFNAEEFGCLGSKAFIEKHGSELMGSRVFNFDMIGSDNGVPLCIMGGETDTANTELVKSAASVCSDEKIYFNYLFKDSSDHEYFRKNGIDAITFCDNDLSKIHTPLDKSDFLKTSAIERCFNVVSKEVLKYGYSGNILIMYNKEIFLFCALHLSIIFISTALYTLRKNGKLKFIFKKYS